MNTKPATVRLGLIAAMAAVTMVGVPTTRAAEAGRTPGDQRRWALTLRVRLEQPGGQQPVEVVLSGNWVSTISGMRPGEYEAMLQLANAHIEGAGIKSAAADAAAQMERRLARPFWGTYRDDGALLAVHFFKDVNASDRNLLQTVATETQLVCDSPDRPVWTVTERDGAGEYLAIYNRQEPGVVVKRKLKYVYIDGAAGTPADGLHLDVQQSELRFSLDPDGEIATLEGSNRIRIGAPVGDGGQLTTIFETHLTNLRRGQSRELIASLVRALPEVESSPVVTHKRDPEQARAERDGRLIEGRTTESLLEAVQANEKDQMLNERLAALFRQRPRAAAAALDLLRKSGAQDRITAALGAAGSPTAIEALGSIAGDATLPGTLRIDALNGLILVQRPSPEAMRIPNALLDDKDATVASAAAIASGALARAGRAAQRAEADTIDAALIARYRNAKKAGERSNLLDALGNSGGPMALPVIEDALRDPGNPARPAAARALRLAEGPEVDGLLSGAITGDKDPHVRSGAVLAAGFRHPIGPVLGEALVRAASADPVPHVRSSAISLLRQNPDASARIAETLKWISENDTEPGIRRLAEEALKSFSGEPAR